VVSSRDRTIKKQFTTENACTPDSRVTFIGDTFAASQLVRLYADPGSTVLFQFARNDGSGLASGNISVTGYLEDAN
jgi:hypothetical protein